MWFRLNLKVFPPYVSLAEYERNVGLFPPLLFCPVLTEEANSFRISELMECVLQAFCRWNEVLQYV